MNCQKVNDSAKADLRWVFRLTIFLSLLFFISCEKKGRIQLEDQIGKPAPLFTLKDLNGTHYSIEQWKGRVVLLRFWATRCESCKIEMPKLQSSFRNMMANGFMVVAVNVEDPVEKASQFVTELGLTFPVLIDEDQKVTNLYQVYGVPTTFFIDRNGVIKERVFGDLNNEAIEKLVKPLL